MASPYQEDPVLLHRALLNCIRRSSSSEDRRSYLCVMENIIAQKTGVPVKSPFFSMLQSSADEITRNLSYEIQQIKMEDQVESLVVDNSPPEEVGAMGNMIPDNDLVDQNGHSSDESSGDDDDFIDLSELILNEPLPIDIPVSRPPLSADMHHPLNMALNVPPVATMPSMPILDSRAPLTPADSVFQNDPFLTDPLVSRPPLRNDTHPPIDLTLNLPAVASRPPLPVIDPRSPLTSVDSVFGNGIVESPTLLPATRVPGQSNIEVCNSVPQIPITMVRPKGYLPSSLSTTTTPDSDTPPIPHIPEYETVPLRKTRAASSEQRFSQQDSVELHSRENNLSRQSSVNSSTLSRQNSNYETRPLPRPGAGAVSSSYSEDVSRKNSTGNPRETNRSSSSEEASISQPETHKGSTVYRSKRITHLQLLAFLENTALKAELKELGAFYMISACEEPKFYNISISGDRATTSKAVELFTASLPPDNSEYITEEVPIPVYQELKESGYLLQLFRQLYPGVDIKVDRSDSKQLIYQLSGSNNHVFEVVSMIKFMTSLPDKKFGMLLKLHNRLTNSAELIDRLINSAQNITKSPVMCLDCTKTEACKFLFVPGLCGTENQYKLQKHLNVLVEKFEQAETIEMTPTPSLDLPEDPLAKTFVKYSFEELLIIRDKCTEPHKELLENSSLPIKLITKINHT